MLVQSCSLDKVWQLKEPEIFQYVFVFIFGHYLIPTLLFVLFHNFNNLNVEISNNKEWV